MENQPDPGRPPGGGVVGPGGGLPPPPPGPPFPPPPRSFNDDRSIGDLLGELVGEATTLLKQEAELAKTFLKQEAELAKTLLQQEVELAKTEVRQEVRTAAPNVGYVVAGGAVAYAGLIVLLIGLGWLLGRLFGPTLIWLGLLLVGVVTAAIGYALVQKGISKLKEMSAVPERTVETLKENQQWLKDEINP
jgi:hypothetical protein